MGKNVMWQVYAPKQRDKQRGRWKTRTRVQKEVAIEVIRGYLKHIEQDSMTLLVKQKEIEPTKWEEANITQMIPPSWYPGGIISAENYRGPKMDYGDHFNGKEAIKRWTEKMRAQYWCSG